jgi:dynein light intermediate chain 1, cytosolic
VPSPLQTLIHSSLGVHSLIKKQPLKHNVIDRDKVVLPPNWDSWGKIRVLREGFDVEGVNHGWSIDIEEPSRSTANGSIGEDDGRDREDEQPFREPVGALAHYEETIRDPGTDLLSASSIKRNGQKLDVESMDPQSFLASQLEVLERIKNTTDSSSTDDKRDSSARKPSHSGVDIDEERNIVEEGRVNEHIGPVQFNVGGIQVDADDMLKRLKVINFLLFFYYQVTSRRTAKPIKLQARKHLVWYLQMVISSMRQWLPSSQGS